MRPILSHLCSGNNGATAVEYGLIAAAIAVAAVAAFSLVGTNLSGVFNTISSYL